VGSGGVFVELLRDSTAELAPVEVATALNMLHRLKCIALLTGFRGSKAADLLPIAEAIARISELISDQRQRIVEIDINPVICGPEGPIAVDALVLRA
jgi:acetyl-CoA synthetase